MVDAYPCLRVAASVAQRQGLVKAIATIAITCLNPPSADTGTPPNFFLLSYAFFLLKQSPDFACGRVNVDSSVGRVRAGARH